MWDSKKFSATLKTFQKKGRVFGREFSTLGNLQEALATKLGYSVETIISWRRPNSKGPSEQKTVQALCEIFQTDFNTDTVYIEEEGDNADMNEVTTSYSDFTKIQIFNCYQLIKTYVDSEIDFGSKIINNPSTFSYPVVCILLFISIKPRDLATRIHNNYSKNHLCY